MSDEFDRREIARLTVAVDKLTETIIGLRKEMAETYVRKDVYLEARKLDAEAGLALTEKVNSLISLRDWVLKIIVGAVIVALLGLVLVSNGGVPS